MIDTDKYEGHTPPPWECNDIEGREIWKCLFNGECFTDPSTYGTDGYEEVVIATMNPLSDDENEEEFTTMMTNKILMADAPLFLEEVKRLRRVLEDIESMIPDNHEEISPILSDILSECHRVLPMFNEVIE
jgi:hypothetical protein